MNLPNDKDLMKTPWNDSVPTVTLKIKEIDEVFNDINYYNDYWLDSIASTLALHFLERSSYTFFLISC